MISEVPVRLLMPEAFLEVVDASALHAVQQRARDLQSRLGERTIWNINSTASGGGVAEMLHSFLAYSRGFGVHARWLVVSGTPDFFRITKRLHNALHGFEGDGSPLGEAEQQTYRQVTDANAAHLADRVRAGDVVVCHDPQTAGLIAPLHRNGVRVIWRCHIGGDVSDPQVQAGWRFLAPHLSEADAYVFSRRDYVPDCCDPACTMIVHPAIDPFSVKNQEMDAATVRAILVQTGLVQGPNGHAAPGFRRADGGNGRVTRTADVNRVGEPPRWDVPLVVQVSRWDRLKDPLGVLEGFGHASLSQSGAELVLAGPSVEGVTDDPEGQQVLNEVTSAFTRLPEDLRRRVHLATIPMHDLEENAAIINALQRHATIVVQKSLQEGFGLTVTEAMWKGRAVVASAVGGIQDQIEHGVHGLLVDDPVDLDAFAAAIGRLLGDEPLRRALGERARRRVREQFLGLRSLTQFADLIGGLPHA